MDKIIRDELVREPHYHRKQWEFASIFRELERSGVLDGTCRGISFGAGIERVLYAVARRSAQLVATDLYQSSTNWKGARTADPETHVRAASHFPLSEHQLTAQSMDMREIAFPDDSFDFAYSSCAIEHIGLRDDFIRHLREVKRVLKPGGLYAFTTELNYTDVTIEKRGMHFFSRHFLEDLVRESGLSCDPVFDASLWQHHINTPLPARITNLLNPSESHLLRVLLSDNRHIQLLLANLPHTSCILVLRKGGESFREWSYSGWEATRDFIQRRTGVVRNMVEKVDLLLTPFARVKNGRSPWYAGHDEFFNAQAPMKFEGPFFETDFAWLGTKRRTARIELTFATPPKTEHAIAVGVRKFSLRADKPQVIGRTPIAGPDLHYIEEIDFQPEDHCSYSIFGRAGPDAPRLTAIALSFPAPRMVH